MILRHIILLGRILPAIAMLAGCYSMDVASNSALDKHGTKGSRHAEHVVVSNYGWYLFNCLPLACGNTNPKASFPWSFFSNQVSSSLLHDRMMEYAMERNAPVKELPFFRDEQVFFNVPGTQFPIPIPYVLCFREVQFSGILTPRAEEVAR